MHLYFHQSFSLPRLRSWDVVVDEQSIGGAFAVFDICDICQLNWCGLSASGETSLTDSSHVDNYSS